MAKEEKQVTDVSAPADGQIALTAHNNGDGTWSVTRGPKGAVLQDGLPREKALAIVGGATGPYEPMNEQEAKAGEERAALEAKAADITNAEAEKADEPGTVKTVRPGVDTVKAVGAAGTGGGKAKNGDA